jgi:hypothetical protein
MPAQPCGSSKIMGFHLISVVEAVWAQYWDRSGAIFFHAYPCVLYREPCAGSSSSGRISGELVAADVGSWRRKRVGAW